MYRLGGVSLCSFAGLLLISSATPSLAASASCDSLANASFPDTKITSATANTATDKLPEHCEVIGAINTRTSPVDKQTYAIKFHLRMPTQWNGGFFYSGGGGTDGMIGTADVPAIRDGYAVVSSDSGHDNASNTSELAGAYQFGFDPQARSDFGYNGPARVVATAKAIVQRFYGNTPKRSYFVGCSEGGREGMMFSQRYPDYFDGIVAGDPGMDLPKAAVAEAWDSQQFARAARSKTPAGNPDLASSFTEDELAAVGAAISAKCDADDGVADGMVFKARECQFDPATLGPAGKGTLSQQQVTALQQVFAGAHDSKGKALYEGWLWDPGIASPGWRAWKTGPIAPNFPLPGNSAINVTLGGGSLPFIFNTPPNVATHGTDLAPASTVKSANPLGAPGAANFGDAFVPYVLSFNMDTDAPQIFARSGVYREAAMDFMASSGTDYTNFRKRGSKLIVYSGQADPVFSTKYHTQWYDKLTSAQGGLAQTQTFARLFIVPGMNHCAGGPSTSQFDAFAALVNWVEKGVAPQQIIATAPPGTPWPGRTRPLCAYPQHAQYKGAGNVEDAASFVCQ